MEDCPTEKLGCMFGSSQCRHSHTVRFQTSTWIIDAISSNEGDFLKIHTRGREKHPEQRGGYGKGGDSKRHIIINLFDFHFFTVQRFKRNPAHLRIHPCSCSKITQKNPETRFLHSPTGAGEYWCFDQCGPPQRSRPVSALPAWPPLSTWVRLPLPSFLHHARQDGPRKGDPSKKYHKLDPTALFLVILNILTTITVVPLAGRLLLEYVPACAEKMWLSIIRSHTEAAGHQLIHNHILQDQT